MSSEETPHKNELPDAFSLFKPSWEAFKCNLETFVWQLLLPVALIALAIFVWAPAVAIDIPVVYGFAAVVAVALLCFSVVVTTALVKTQVASVRKQVVGFRQSLRQISGYVWRLIGLFLLCTLIIVIGFVLLIVPGLFAMQRLLLAPYFLVDQNTGVREAIRRSWRAGKQFSGPIWGVVGILIGINFISLVPVFGWIVSIVFTVWYLNAPAIRYIQVTKKHAVDESTPVEA